MGVYGRPGDTTTSGSIVRQIDLGVGVCVCVCGPTPSLGPREPSPFDSSHWRIPGHPDALENFNGGRVTCVWNPRRTGQESPPAPMMTWLRKPPARKHPGASHDQSPDSSMSPIHTMPANLTVCVLSGPIDRKQYASYSLAVDPDQNDKATEFRLCSVARPHMRAFHCAWWCHFNSFFLWFSITPLLPEIRDTLQLSNEDIWTSSIIGVAGTILMRFLLGPLCDTWGARTLFSAILLSAAVPTACTGLVQSAVGLYVLRLAIGLVVRGPSELSW